MSIKKDDTLDWTSVKKYRRYALVAAQDLGYGKQVETQIKCAKTSDEISMILTKARAKWANSQL